MGVSQGHFAFHKSCIMKGIKNPTVWSRVDGDLKVRMLVLKSVSYPSSGGYQGNRSGPSSAANRSTAPITETLVCLRFNDRGYTLDYCKFRHACRTCGGAYSAGACRNTTTTANNPGFNANATPIGKRE